MHWEEVEGVKVPVRLGGHPALDFCNTWAGWNDLTNPRGEWLRSYDDLAVWTFHAGLLGLDDVRRLRRRAGRDPHDARAILSEARGLRTATHSVALDPTDERATAVVTGHVRRSAAVVRLEPGRRPRWTFTKDSGLALPLRAVAWSVGDLLTTVDLERVRSCPGPECGWLFLDTSGRRRWCSMASCGNRAKVSAFAARRRSDSSAGPSSTAAQ